MDTDRETLDYLKNSYKQQIEEQRQAYEEDERKKEQGDVYSASEALNREGREREEKKLQARVEARVEKWKETHEPEIFQDWGGSQAAAEQMLKEEEKSKDSPIDRQREQLKRAFNQYKNDLEQGKTIDKTHDLHKEKRLDK